MANYAGVAGVLQLCRCGKAYRHEKKINKLWCLGNNENYVRILKHYSALVKGTKFHSRCHMTHFPRSRRNDVGTIDYGSRSTLIVVRETLTEHRYAAEIIRPICNFF